MRIALLIPSLLSGARLVLAFPIGWLILEHRWHDTLAITLAAGLTDAADGWVARRWRLITRAGAWLDPVADKALAATLFVCLGVAGAVPAWLVWMVFGRDLFILLMAGYALAFTPFRDFPPSVWGKISTIIQGLTAFTALLRQAYPSEFAEAILTGLIAATVAGTAFSGVHYAWTGLRRVRALRQPSG